jgi:hypothetical protein
MNFSKNGHFLMGSHRKEHLSAQTVQLALQNAALDGNSTVTGSVAIQGLDI